MRFSAAVASALSCSLLLAGNVIADDDAQAPIVDSIIDAVVDATSSAPAKATFTVSSHLTLL